jgi:PAS domain S-box-containing protein
MVKLSPPLTILNVDDHEISRYSKSRVLQQAGFQVKEVGTGLETLHLIHQEHPSLVLLDVNLPDISGFEVCRRIKGDPALSSIMVLQISASLVTSSDKARGLEGGADAYLSEPVEPIELIAHVRALLRLRQAELELQAQRTFLRQVIDLNPNLIFAKDRAGRFTLANQAVAEVYGTTVEELIGKTDADFNSDAAELEHFQADDLEVIDKQQEKFIPEETITDAAGQVRWLQTVKRPIIDEAQQAQQVLGVATDITARKQAQIELTQLNETLEQRVVERTALLQLLHEVAAAANEAETIETTLQFALDRICAYTDWPVGHVYWLNRENPSELISSRIWHLDEPEQFEPFRQATEAARLSAGVGLPGRVWANGEPIWLVDVTQDSNFQRVEAAAQSGLRAGFGFALWVGQEIVAVLEFYSPKLVEPTGSFLEAVTQIGTQLGRVVERRRAERRIRESEQQLLEAQQIAHLGSWQWDIPANHVYWSDEMYRIYGLAPQSVEITFEGFLERVYPDDRERISTLIMAAYQGSHPFDFEHRIVRPDGAIRTLHAQGRVILDEAGRPIKMVGIGHDITERKETEEQLRHLNVELEQRVSERTAQLEEANQELAEEINERKQIEAALRASEQQMRLITDAAPALIAYVDQERRYRFLNRAYETWFGYAPAEFEGRPVKEILGETAYEVVRPYLEAALAGQEISYEQRVPYQPGLSRYVHAHYMPDFDEQGGVRGYVSLVYDITERKRAEETERLLAAASETLMASPDYKIGLSKLARLLVSNLADWCVVDVIGDDGLIHRLTVVHRDPAKAKLAAQLRRHYPALDPHGEHTITKMLRQGRSWFDPAVSPIRLAAEARDARHLRLLQSLGFASEMVVPLIARGRSLGALTLVRMTGEPAYKAADLSLAEELARRAALAIDNARLYEAEQRARQKAEETAERIAGLQGVTAELSKALTPAQVAQAILDHGVLAMGASTGIVALLTDNDEFEIIGAIGDATKSISQWRRFPAKTGLPIPDVVYSGEPLFLPSRKAAAARYPELMATLESSQEAGVIVPLVGEDKPLGALSITFTEVREFSAEEREFILTLAQQCAQALERARLYEAEQQARQEAEQTAAQITTLQAITAAFSEALTPAQVARVVVEQGFRSLGAEAGSVALFNEHEETLVTLDSVGYPAELIEKWLNYPVTTAVPISEAVLTKTPVYVESLEVMRAHYPQLLKERMVSHQALAAVPLIVEGRVLGGLGLSFAEPQEFNATDRAFIMALAQQCAQALERARLYEVEQQARLEAETNQQRLALLAEMRERNRLAQELHDTVAQALGYLNLKIGMTYTMLASDRVDAAKANLQELKQVISETYTDVREEIFNLRAKLLSGLSFMEMLDRYIDKYRRFYNLDIQLAQEAEATLFEFPAEVSSQLIRTIQEALINIRKHAHVETATIRLSQEDDHIQISIEDKGQGFDPSQAAEKTSSFGLQIMRERVESVGGSLKINTAPGQGTQIILSYRK